MKSDIAGSRAREFDSLGAVKDMEVRCEQVETNSIVRVQDGIPTDGPIPVEPLLVFYGLLNGVSARILKDDGCSTNVISRRFFGLHRQRFHVRKAKIVINHSNEDSSETASQLVLNGTLKIGSHTYTSNWVVANCRYDVLLGMPWHVAHNPNVDYVKRVVKIGSDVISVDRKNLNGKGSVKKKDKLTMTNLGVKEFRQMLQKR